MGLVSSIKHHGVIGAAQRLPRKILREIRRRRYQAIGAEFAQTDYGVDMVANWGDSTFEMCYRAEFGWFLANLLLHKRTDPFTFLDVGANQGLYSLIAAENPACAQVVALEPVRETADTLKRNIAVSRVGSKITALQVGLSDKDGSAEIYLAHGDTGRSSLHHKLPGDGVEKIELVTAATLGQHLRGNEFPILVKVDVEGHEATVLAELASAPWCSRVDQIFYEIDERWSSPTEIELTLSRAGFRSFERIGRSSMHYDVLSSR